MRTDIDLLELIKLEVPKVDLLRIRVGQRLCFRLLRILGFLEPRLRFRDQPFSLVVALFFPFRHTVERLLLSCDAGDDLATSRFGEVLTGVLVFTGLEHLSHMFLGCGI